MDKKRIVDTEEGKGSITAVYPCQLAVESGLE